MYWINMQTSTTARYILGFLLAVLLSGCSKPTNANVGELEKEFLTAVPIVDMNKSLQVVVDSNNEAPKNGSEIGLTIYNKSSHTVQFDNSSFVKLLGSTDHLHWFPIKNGLTYLAHMSLSPQGTLLLDLSNTWVRPILEPVEFGPDKSDVLLRIAVVGEIVEDDKPTGEKIGAYVDMVLQP
jgi:hypothetical protein